MAATTTVDEIVERATELTDVTDPAPAHFLDNLGAVIDAVNTEAALTDEGIQGILYQLVPALRNRIEVDAYVAEHPEVDTTPLPAPIFLTGLPRSGTTYFQYLFDQDPRLRMLRTHGVIRKVTGTHRYHLTNRGRELIAALAKTQEIQQVEDNRKTAP